MDTDDLEPRKPLAKPKDLDSMSIEELRDYIADMEAEIVRVKGKIDAKLKHRAAMDGVFKR
jgi:uncharacterized small protein (DUF1192 family)